MPGYIWDNYHIKSFTRVNFIDYLTLSSGKCAGLELEWLKCADRVGLMNSREKCKESFEDFQECSWRIKTKRRREAIRTEMRKQNVGPAQLPENAK